MSPRYIRKRLDVNESMAAGLVSAALGLTVGVVTLYIVRLMLAREPLPGSSGASPDSSSTDQ